MTINTVKTLGIRAMSDRGSNSGFRSLVKDKDVAPGDSASQAGSSMSRASEKARRAAARCERGPRVDVLLKNQK